jgi:hypothetical protein
MSSFSQFQPKFGAGNIRYFLKDQYTFNNHVKADGSILSQSTYPQLFSKMGILTIDTIPSFTTQTGSSSSSKITYGNGIYVVGGNSGSNASRTSTNGINWTNRTIPEFNSVVYANGIFVIAGNGGSLNTSTNGINWTTRTSGTTSSIMSIVYDESNEVFIYGGRSTATNTQTPFATSTDAINWTARTNYFPFAAAANGARLITSIYDMSVESGTLFVAAVSFYRVTTTIYYYEHRFGSISIFDILNNVGTVTNFYTGFDGNSTSPTGFPQLWPYVKITANKNFVSYINSLIGTASAAVHVPGIYSRNRNTLTNSLVLPVESNSSFEELKYENNLFFITSSHSSSPNGIRTSTDSINWTTNLTNTGQKTRSALVQDQTVFVVDNSSPNTNILRGLRFDYNSSTEYKLPSPNKILLSSFQLPDNQITTYIKTK